MGTDLGGGFDTASRDELVEAVLAKLDGVEADTAAELVGQLVGPLAEMELTRVLSQLLAQGVPVAQITAAILQCLLYCAERIADGADAQERAARKSSIAGMIMGFARVQELWMALVNEHYQALLHERDDALRHSNERLLVETARAQWLKAGVVELFNYFCELPVTANARVHELDSVYLTVEHTAALRQVLAASDRGTTVLASSSDPEKAVMLRRQGSDEEYVVFRVVGVADHHEGRRRRVRIRPPRPTALSLRLAGEVVVSGKMIDFSVIGLGAVLRGVDTLPIGARVECTAVFEGRGRPYELRSTGSVRWSEAAEDGCRVGIELAASQSQIQALERLTHEFQRDVIALLGRRVGEQED